jgi:hypothetical protein
MYPCMFLNPAGQTAHADAASLDLHILNSPRKAKAISEIPNHNLCSLSFIRCTKRSLEMNTLCLRLQIFKQERCINRSGASGSLHEKCTLATGGVFSLCTSEAVRMDVRRSWLKIVPGPRLLPG